MVIYKEIERKRNILEQAEKLKKKGLNLKEIREVVGVSKRTGKTIGKSQERIRQYLGLGTTQSKRPRRLVSPRVLTNVLAGKIEALRKENPYYSTSQNPQIAVTRRLLIMPIFYR